METILLYTDLEAILFLFLSLLLIIQICYYTLLYNKVNRYNRMKAVKQVTDELPPLSVIICARDQAESLRQNLPSILEQDYPNFEVIVINDGSTDESENLLKRFSAKYSHLYHTFTPSDSRYLSRKKLSMTLGIKASKNPWLVFTEANCVPSSNQWLRLMARNFTPDTQIVLGYSNCQSIDGWLNKRVVFNLFFQSLRFLGFALNGKPYMGIGKNMAYRRELFFEAKGYSEYLNLQRGEDDLFINKLANKQNTRVETDPNATIQLQSYYSKEWKDEKKNYLLTSKHYKGKQRFILGFETTSRFLFYLTVVAGIVMSCLSAHWFVLGLFILFWGIRYIMQAIIFKRTAKSLGQPFKMISLLPVFDLLQPLQTFIYKIETVFGRNKEYMRR